MSRLVEVIKEVREQRGGQPICAKAQEKEEARWMDERVARKKMNRMMTMRRRRRKRKRKNRSRRRKGEQEEEGEQKGQRSRECFPELLGLGHLGAFWRPLGTSWGSLGGPEEFLGVLDASGEPRRAAWGALGSILGASWGHHGAILGPSWRLLEPPGRLVGPSWRTSIKEERGFNYSPPSGAP